MCRLIFRHFEERLELRRSPGELGWTSNMLIFPCFLLNSFEKFSGQILPSAYQLEACLSPFSILTIDPVWNLLH